MGVSPRHATRGHGRRRPCSQSLERSKRDWRPTRIGRLAPGPSSSMRSNSPGVDRPSVKDFACFPVYGRNVRFSGFPLDCKDGFHSQSLLVQKVGAVRGSEHLHGSAHFLQDIQQHLGGGLDGARFPAPRCRRAGRPGTSCRRLGTAPPEHRTPRSSRRTCCSRGIARRARRREPSGGTPASISGRGSGFSTPTVPGTITERYRTIRSTLDGWRDFSAPKTLARLPPSPSRTSLGAKDWRSRIRPGSRL